MKNNWDWHVDRLEQYFIVNDVKYCMRVAILITWMGSVAYELIDNLCAPNKPSSNTYEHLVTVMKSNLQMKQSRSSERYKFRQRIQTSESAS